jgi:transposase
MQVMFPHCAGLDVHKKTVTATVSHHPADVRKAKTITQTFGTFTDELIAMREWLVAEGVTHVAMEATGSYWKPVFNVLEDTFVTWVVNPAIVKAFPGRKTDVKDSAWIADLLQHGLIRPSFIPDRDQRELRELVRYRKTVIQERAREITRIQKVLEGANIKLGSVLSDVLGVSGFAMLSALVQGETDPQKLAELADSRVRASCETLARALNGVITDKQRWLLGRQLNHLAYLEREIELLDIEVAARTRPFEEARKLLQTIPGVKNRVTDVILAEIGPNVASFPSAAALSKWAGVAPGNKTSGGKRLSGRTQPGNRLLRSTLVEAAWAASRTKGTYFQAQYSRLVVRLGRKKAAMAVAHSVLVIIWCVLDRGMPYVDIGGDYFDRLDEGAATRRAVRRLKALGYEVTLTKTA